MTFNSAERMAYRLREGGNTSTVLNSRCGFRCDALVLAANLLQFISSIHQEICKTSGGSTPSLNCGPNSLLCCSCGKPVTALCTLSNHGGNLPSFCHLGLTERHPFSNSEQFSEIGVSPCRATCPRSHRSQRVCTRWAEVELATWRSVVSWEEFEQSFWEIKVRSSNQRALQNWTTKSERYIKSSKEQPHHSRGWHYGVLLREWTSEWERERDWTS